MPSLDELITEVQTTAPERRTARAARDGGAAARSGSASRATRCSRTTSTRPGGPVTPGPRSAARSASRSRRCRSASPGSGRSRSGWERYTERARRLVQEHAPPRPRRRSATAGSGPSTCCSASTPNRKRSRRGSSWSSASTATQVDRRDRRAHRLRVLGQGSADAARVGGARVVDARSRDARAQLRRHRASTARALERRRRRRRRDPRGRGHHARPRPGQDRRAPRRLHRQDSRDARRASALCDTRVRSTRRSGDARSPRTICASSTCRGASPARSACCCSPSRAPTSIKVEPPGGDPFRDYSGYAVWNRSRRSVTST